jgi:TM2 domain-containing membrane protein YozV
MTDKTHTPAGAGPIPLVGFVTSLWCSGGGQWLNRQPIKAIAATTVLWAALQHSATSSPVVVALCVLGLAVEATITAVLRDPGHPMSPPRPLVAGAASMLPALGPLALGAGHLAVVVGAGQLYNGHIARAAIFAATWWAAVIWWPARLGYAVYLIPAAASIEALAVAFTQLDNYRTQD